MTMVGLLDSAYYVMVGVWQVLETFWPFGYFSKKRFRSPTPETQQKVLAATLLLRKDKGDENVARDIIQGLSIHEDILAITDISGFNLLQHAVIRGRSDIVKVLLLRGYDANSGCCSLSLHLAAYLGDEELVHLLVNNGAKLDKLAGMCFPAPHIPLLFRVNYLGLTQQAVYECHSDKRMPIHCAIDKDHIKIVQYLFTGLREKCLCRSLPAELLHYACKMGSLECLKFFIEKWPGEVEKLDGNSNSPLLLAVPWGQKYVQLLIEHGADVRKRTRLGETALHKLYRHTKDGFYSIYDTTKFLLMTGLEQDINVTDHKDTTALHVLVGHLFYVIGKRSQHDEQCEGDIEELQDKYQRQVIQTIELLIKYNADVNHVNVKGLQPLSKLLHIIFNLCCSGQPHSCIELDKVDSYAIDFQTLNDALIMLLKNGADPNKPCQQGHSPLILFLECMLSGNPQLLCNQSDEFVSCLETLLYHGADTNFVTSNRATCSTLLAKIGERYFSLRKPGTKEAIAISQQFSVLVNSCLHLLLQFGLNPNHITTKQSRHLEGGTGNGLIEFIRLAELATVPSDLGVVHMWLRTLLQWGADPDIEPYPSDPIICHSQSSIFLKKQGTQPVSHYIHEAQELHSIFDDGHAMDLLFLFYNTMEHKILYECLHTAKFMSRFHPKGATGEEFLTILNELMDNPRSLKAMSRIAIYKSLHRELATKVPRLPLPQKLQRYLLEIDP